MHAGEIKITPTENTKWITLALVVACTFYILELVLYLNLFHFIYKHDSGSFALRPEVKKSRNNCNAQTMMGQFYLFLTDTWYSLFLLFAFAQGVETMHPETKDIGAFLKSLEFGFLSLVQCFLIPEQRRKVDKWFHHSKIK